MKNLYSKEDIVMTISLIVIVLSGIFVMIALPIAFNASYRQGQIDALTGKVHYVLVTHSDQTKTWERNSERKN